MANNNQKIGESMAQKIWSDEEVSFLEENPLMSRKEMAEFLQRSYNSVCQKLSYMKNTKKRQGENHPNAKLTAEHVEMMRVLDDAGYRAGKIKTFAAAVNGVAVQSVDDVINYRTWR